MTWIFWIFAAFFVFCFISALCERDQREQALWQTFVFGIPILLVLGYFTFRTPAVKPDPQIVQDATWTIFGVIGSVLTSTKLWVSILGGIGIALLCSMGDAKTAITGVVGIGIFVFFCHIGIFEKGMPPYPGYTPIYGNLLEGDKNRIINELGKNKISSQICQIGCDYYKSEYDIRHLDTNPDTFTVCVPDGQVSTAMSLFEKETWNKFPSNPNDWWFTFIFRLIWPVLWTCFCGCGATWSLLNGSFGWAVFWLGLWAWAPILAVVVIGMFAKKPNS